MQEPIPLHQVRASSEPEVKTAAAIQGDGNAGQQVHTPAGLVKVRNTSDDIRRQFGTGIAFVHGAEAEGQGQAVRSRHAVNPPAAEKEGVEAPASGDLKILAKALTDEESDAVETGMLILPRGLKYTRADSFAIADEEADKTVTVKLPANADPNARTLRVEVSPTIAGTLFGALDYLTSYPYGCTEQTMSSFLPNVIVTQALQNFCRPVRISSFRFGL